MKIRTLALAVLAASAATVAAASADDVAKKSSHRSSALAQTVAWLEAQYPGRVTAIELDTSGDKAPHYHVDMSFPASGIARIDVDAVTYAIASRDAASVPASAATLPEAVSLVGAHVPGQVTTAMLDASAGAPAHYDIDVALPSGQFARLKVDPATRQIAWRNPAIGEP